jgi:hypothetical protein
MVLTTLAARLVSASINQRGARRVWLRLASPALIHMPSHYILGDARRLSGQRASLEPEFEL